MTKTHPLRFASLTLPNIPWADLLARYKHMEALGFDVAGVADHFVDWSGASSDWFEAWTVAAAVAQATNRIRIGTWVAQIPLRNPAMLAFQARTVDHISGGRLELGLGIGLTIDPSYKMMGLPNWGNRERTARFPEYVEVVDGLLSNPLFSYAGEHYSLEDAVMEPPAVQQPRPPIMIAAMGPVMLKHAARYADTWNSLSFLNTFEAQLAETRERIARIDEHCAAIGRDPASLRRSYLMFDATAAPVGGSIRYYESVDLFTDMVGRLTELGITEIGMHYPRRTDQVPMLDRLALEIIPKLKAAHNAGLAG